VRERERGSSLFFKMASATASTLSTLCSSFTTHCSTKPQFSVSHQPFSSRFPSQSACNFSFQSTFSQRFPLLPVSKATESSVADVEAESDVSPAQSESEATQIVQTPSWEKGLFAVVMVSFLNVKGGLGDPFVSIVQKLHALCIMFNLDCSMGEGDASGFAYFWLYDHGYMI